MPIFLDTDMSNEEAKILIVGVGGGGGNAVNRMIEDEIKGVDYVVANTDYQALKDSLAENKVQLGEKLTKGLGAGAKPEIGRKAAEESYDKIKEELEGYHMIFISAGMGGGTGTGAAPVVAKIAKEELGALTVAIVTMPFRFEGAKKQKLAKEGLEELKNNVDSIIVLPNDKIFEVSPKGTSMDDAFRKGNEVLKKGVKGITDIIKVSGIVNPDFADVRTVMEEKGVCHMGFGKAKGENRAIEAVKMAITSPLLDTSVKNSSNLLVSIVATKESLKIDEFSAIGDFVSEAVGENDGHLADHIILGSSYVEDMGEELSVTIIATGVDIVKNDNIIDINRTIAKKQAEKIAEKMAERDEKPVVDDLDIDLDDDIEKEKTPIQVIKEVKEAKDKKSSEELNIPPFLKNTMGKRK